MAGTGMYSADVTVTDAMGGDQMVPISASDAIGNASEAVSATVSIHVVTSASFSPADVSTGDTVMVSAMGTAGLTATYNVFNAEGTNIVTEGMLTESLMPPEAIQTVRCCCRCAPDGYVLGVCQRRSSE